MPTLEDVLPKLHKAKVFTKLDVKEAFWHIKLDAQSRELTTMITPFGRYRWARLPFGLKVSSEVFQKRLKDALCDLQGVTCVADDIIVIGCGDTREKDEADHDEKLAKLYQRCVEQKIKLNTEKAEVKKTEITFIGHSLTKDGVLPDRAKVEAILQMPPPEDIHGVKRLCGMIQYMSKFVPNLASDIEPIRSLTRKDVPWEWSESCKKAFQIIKKKLTEAPLLTYYNPDKELTIQVDSSKDGLGAALLQDGRLLEYASRSLTPSERKWAQIEKEALAVIYGLERFDQYTFGRLVHVQNDHKPLETILRKPLSQAPKRIQSIMMRLHRYDIQFRYVPGSKLVIADTLSRAYVKAKEDSNQDSMIMNVVLNSNEEEIPDTRREEIRQAIKTDDELLELIEIIQNGWPKDKRQLPENLHPYFQIRDTLSYEDGLIVKGEKLLIPKSLRGEMKKRLHAAHMGYDSMVRRAHKYLFWIGMTQEIKQLAQNCDICYEFKARNQKEPLKQHHDGSYPYEKVGVDLCEFKGRNYLITVDYFSNFIEADYMMTTTSAQVIICLKRHFARYGIPKCLVSECGSQFTSKEFEQFLKSWGILHVKSSPGHHQANGKVEAMVKIFKNVLKKTAGDQYIALLELRNTPRQSTKTSPAELMFGRGTRTFIPQKKKAKGGLTNLEEYQTKRDIQKRATKRTFDKHAKELKPLHVNDSVYYQNPEKAKWHKGVIRAKQGERSYVVEGPGNKLYQRNRLNMRFRHTSDIPEEEEVEIPEVDNTQNASQSNDKKTDEISLKPPEMEEPKEKKVGLRSRSERHKPSWMADYVCQLLEINNG